MIKELHLTKKDFRVQWYSGTGAGGQHRNKHQNCCRIIHKETGLSVVGTASKERSSNQRQAFRKLARLIIAHHSVDEKAREINPVIIRNYSEYRNEVHDKASGLKLPYRHVVIDGDLSEMIKARREAVLNEIS